MKSWKTKPKDHEVWGLDEKTLLTWKMKPKNHAVWELDEETEEVTELFHYTNWVDDDGY